ncbi:MAG: ABC transporter ATP-binding protein [Planctomycetota bacterium]
MLPGWGRSKRMGDGEVLIRAEGVGKKFCRDLRKSLWYGVCDSAAAINPWWSSNKTVPGLRPGEFWANQDIDFEVRRGECLGLIGPNGAGKTTLLKMIGVLIRPDAGRLEIRGSVGGLIALEAGFNPVLSGRDNVMINGAILGLSRRVIKDRMDEIVDFAGIPEAIDAPVQTYSSGMRVRLGFAVAVCLIQPDVLLLDEVLAVGDAAFRAKCYNAVAKLRESTATIFVSHNMALVSTIASQGLVLHRGKVACLGSISEAVSSYESLNETAGDDPHLLLHDEVRGAKFSLAHGAEHLKTGLLNLGDSLRIDVTLDAAIGFRCVYFDIVFYDRAGEVVGHWSGPQHGKTFSVQVGMNSEACVIERVNLTHGRYALGIVIRCQDTGAVLAWSFKQHQVEIGETMPSQAPYQMQ